MPFHALPLLDALPVSAGVPSLPSEPVPVTRGTPAIAIMSDFASTVPVTCRPDVKIDDALARMHIAGVRSLLVVEQTYVVGLVTAADIQGEKPVRFLQGGDCVHERCHHEDIEVADIMSPIDTLQAIPMTALAHARVGDLMETFRQGRQTHLSVVESDHEGSAYLIRGLFSLSRTEQQLGIDPIHSLTAALYEHAAMAIRL